VRRPSGRRRTRSTAGAVEAARGWSPPRHRDAPGNCSRPPDSTPRVEGVQEPGASPGTPRRRLPSRPRPGSRARTLYLPPSPLSTQASTSLAPLRSRRRLPELLGAPRRHQRSRVLNEEEHSPAVPASWHTRSSCAGPPSGDDHWGLCRHGARSRRTPYRCLTSGAGNLVTIAGGTFAVLSRHADRDRVHAVDAGRQSRHCAASIHLLSAFPLASSMDGTSETERADRWVCAWRAGSTSRPSSGGVLCRVQPDSRSPSTGRSFTVQASALYGLDPRPRSSRARSRAHPGEHAQSACCGALRVPTSSDRRGAAFARSRQGDGHGKSPLRNVRSRSGAVALARADYGVLHAIARVRTRPRTGGPQVRHKWGTLAALSGRPANARQSQKRPSVLARHPTKSRTKDN
jgi:hypothetical protein